MKNKLLLAILSLGLMLGFTACEKNNYDSYPPTWKGFNVNPSKVKAGEKFVVTAVQDEKGHLLNATDYQWYFVAQKGDKKDTLDQKKEHTNYDGISNADPFVEFTVPFGATPTGSGVRYKVYFQAFYSYSGQGGTVASGDNYDSQTYSGAIHTTSGGLSGKAEGNVEVTVLP